MKKQILSLILLLLPLASVLAAEVLIDGIKYNVIKKLNEAEVIKNNYSGNINIPDSIEYEGTIYKVKSIGNLAFYGCTKLTSISIPNTVNSINESAFDSCKGLNSITIPNNVTNIGRNAFYNCTGLTSVHISDLGAWCNIQFFNHDSNPLYCAHHLFLNETEIKDLVIPYSVTEIGQHAFTYCSGLTSVTIPNSVTNIGESAFNYCTGLTSVHIFDLAAWCNIQFSNPSSNPLYYAQHLFLEGEEIKDLVIPNSVTEIGHHAFAHCSGLTSVNISNSVTIIGEAAFYGCEGLTSVTIPNSVTSIYNYAFEGCTGLTSLSIPNSVKGIGISAFYGCSGLTSVTIPNSVTIINTWTFEGCSSLTSVIIPESVTIIYPRAFANCIELTSVYCYAEKAPYTYEGQFDEQSIFEGSHVEYTTLYVPEESVDNYKHSEPWSKFKDIVAINGDSDNSKQCVKPDINYENGILSVTCETEGATCFYSTGAAVITSTDYAPLEAGTDLSRDVQLMIYAYATADGYEKSEVVSKQISVPFGKLITETVTEYVEKWDTAYVNVEVHDTTYVNVELHDTTYVDVPYEVLVHDTAYVNVEVHDTTYVDVPYEVFVHDTTYVDVPYEVVVFDTISVPTTQEIPAPTIVVDDGKVEILSGIKDAVIYYTLDGTTPVVSEGNRYEGPFTISGDCTISAIAVRISEATSKDVIDGIWNPSKTATLHYYRTDGIETDTPTNGVNIVVIQTSDGTRKVSKRLIR